MQIAKILHFHTNGIMASQFVDPLIQAERFYGYDSTMITSINTPGVGGEVIPFDLNIRNLPGILFAFVRICIALAVQKPDLVISHNTKSSLLPLLAAWLLGVKSRVYFNHGVPFIGYKGFLQRILRLLEIFNCNLATNIVTVSRDMQKLLLSLKPTAKVSMIANGSACGIDLNTYNAFRFIDSSFKEDNGISKEDVVVVYIGRPVKRKGFDLALRVWCENFKGPTYKLVLCGISKSDVLKFLPEVPPNVVCMGFVGNIPEILSNSDCLFLPSLHEGFSYAVLEAMACGCLVLANDIKGITYLVEHGKNGYLVSDNSDSGYVKLINSLTERADEIQKIKLNALETAKLFSRECFLPAYLSFIERIIQQKNVSKISTTSVR